MVDKEFNKERFAKHTDLAAKLLKMIEDHDFVGTDGMRTLCIVQVTLALSMNLPLQELERMFKAILTDYQSLLTAHCDKTTKEKNT
jgi:hypothetical protein